MIGEAESAISNASEYMESLEEASEKITDIRYELDDIAELVRDAMSEIDFDPSELDDIEERLDLLYRLSKKYGDTEEEMLEYLSNAQKELESIAFSAEKVQELQKQEKAALADAEKAAAILTESRKSAGEKLSGLICSELEFLDMPNVRFVVQCNDTGLTENGRNSIEFLISANVGEEPKPLAKIASGGELSRIMLAIKNVLAETDGVDTMIFDEIDTGVSGRAAQKIAMKLRSASKGRQVICVTHLAQIAAQGDVHLYISKSVSDGKTYTNIKSLIEDERVAEIARIMGGMEITQLQLDSAREMLEKAENI
jgi:DNA repair protein RecN (Recombination protein N)